MPAEERMQQFLDHLDGEEKHPIRIEEPTNGHRYVVRSDGSPRFVEGTGILSTEQPRVLRIHQQAWRIEDAVLGVSYEWRDVPEVDDSKPVSDVMRDRRRLGLPDYPKPPLGQPPAFLQEQEKIQPGTWCPGCSAYVGEICSQPNCAIGPNGMEARLARVDDSLAKQLQRAIERNVGLAGDNQKLEADRDGLQVRLEASIKAYELTQEKVNELSARLPEGMKNHKIVFEECPKGHGRLRAANWAQNYCLHCRVQKQQEALRYIAENATGAHPENLRKVAEDGLEP